MYEIILESSAIKFLKRLDNNIRKIIIQKMEKLKTNPHLGIRLIGNFKGLWKYRMGNYRLIYKIDNNKLVIVGVDIGHRRNIYK